MALTQQTFLGASITNFNGSIGWGTQASTLGIGLVEDPENGDSFDPPDIGTAVIFDYDQWQFGGILQGYKREYGQQGNPIINVQVQDPRELLDGVQLILADYTGSTYGMSNIYNIYGALESWRGFGGSQSNETGMPWTLLRDTFYTLQLTQPIYFRGAYYLFDPFISLPLLPSYYRIGGDSISALGYVMDICNALSCDFFVEMIPLDNDETPATNVIKIRLIRRNYALRSDAINDFVEQTDGAVAKNSGYELSNEVTSKFVVGGKMNNLYFQQQAYTSPYNENAYDDVVLPYWGYNAYGMLAVGQGDFNGLTGHEYQVTIDGRPLYLQTNNMALVNYTLDLAELHAARAGQQSWEAFLWFYDDEPTSIHYKKATALGLVNGKLSAELMTWLKEWKNGTNPNPPNMASIRSQAKDNALIKNSNIWNEEVKRKTSIVYNYINSYATEYYGKKFMVRVPFVAGAWIPETNKLRFSLIPTQTGYVEESYWGVAAYYGYMPYNPAKFTAEDNRIYPYARFSGMSNTTYTDDDGGTEVTDLRSKYAFDKLPLDSYILDQYPNSKMGKMRENLFVKCNIEETLVYLNPATLFSPRAVVTLVGPVADAVRNEGKLNTALIEEIKRWVKEGAPSDAAVDDWGKTWISQFGQDALWKTKEANFNMPDIVAVPLESQVLRYGPWYVTNGAGRVEFENDSSLVPWGFGSFTAMNLAGWAKVEDALTTQQVHETGSVEYPGVPTLGLGSALLSSGPIVTDVNVNVGEQGVTTTYRMQTWSYQFGRLGKYNVERFGKLSKVTQEQRRAFRKFYGYKPPLRYYDAVTSKDTEDKEDGASNVIAGENIKTGTGDDVKVVPSTATMSVGKMNKHLDDDTYINKAAISMDGLYVPFTSKTNSTSDTLPKFEEPDEGASTPTVEDLNPYGDDSIGMVMPEGSTVPADMKDAETEVKAIAFRSPLVLAGWGHDTDGSRVPSHANYKTRADLWKVGPLDIRWDDARKVWAAGAGASTNVQFFELRDSLFPGASAIARQLTMYPVPGGTSGDPSGSNTTVHDMLLTVGTQHYAGDKIAAVNVTNASGDATWIVLNGQCGCP